MSHSTHSGFSAPPACVLSAVPPCAYFCDRGFQRLARDSRKKATDGTLGHVADFLIDDSTWDVRYLMVDTRNWLPGRKVLVPPSAIEDIDWENRQVRVRLNREELKRSPESP